MVVDGLLMGLLAISALAQPFVPLMLLGASVAVWRAASAVRKAYTN